MTDSPQTTLLSGVRIAAFTQWLLGPAAVQYLADMGADVVKVERPGAGAFERGWSGGNTYLNGESVFFMLTHRNVRSLSLDLKNPAGQTVARRLIETVDVIVENLRPGVLERLGLGYNDIERVKPDIIYASASGYGTDATPYRDLPGQDLLIQAITGMAAATGHGDRPTPAGAAVVDQHAGLLLATGILGALFARERTGRGQRVEVNMVEAALDLQLEPFVYYLNGGQVRRPRVPLGSTFHEAPYGIYETSDGYIALSLSPIARISDALGAPPDLGHFTAGELALREREAIYEALQPHLRTRTTSALVNRLRDHGVWCAPVNDYAAVVDDPGVRHLDPVVEVDHPTAGRVRLLKHPIRYSAAEPAIRRLPPAVGEHSEEILTELGYSAKEIGELRSAIATSE
jgi:crotonobetainyl-CoA:carnitine CoA-transferase CaiB-like acyl-CoA transferase